MRANRVFAAMSREEAEGFLAEIKKEAPDVADMALAAAASAFRLRGPFLRRQPAARQAEWMRRALGRSVGAAIAEEVLASYFLGHRRELLREWLDTVGLEHEDGQLVAESPECPAREQLEKSVAKFRQGDEPERRELLLRAFAAQSAVEWPDLEALLGMEEPA